MGIFDSLKSLTKVVVDTALLPVDVVVDVVTLGGLMTDSDSAIVERAKKIGDGLQDAYDDIDD